MNKSAPRPMTCCTGTARQQAGLETASVPQSVDECCCSMDEGVAAKTSIAMQKMPRRMYGLVGAGEVLPALGRMNLWGLTKYYRSCFSLSMEPEGIYFDAYNDFFLT